MSTRGWLLIHAFLIISVQRVHGEVQACKQKNKFGPLCLFSCHCSVQCDDDTGKCPGLCYKPWSGSSCQRENVAYKKKVNGSRDYAGTGLWSKEKAVDGNRRQVMWSNSCFMSDTYDPPDSHRRAIEAYFYVDLGRPYHTRYITFYGRHREFSPARLNNTRLFVSNTPNDRKDPCYTFDGKSSRGNNIVDLVCVREGRYVTLYDNDLPSVDTGPDASVYMEICELEVYVCSNGTFGPTCDEQCLCRNGSPCNDITGKCSEGCRDGFQGATCIDPCNQSHFGEKCSSTCHCKIPGCDHVSGICRTQMCKDGYKGQSCDTDVDECVQDVNACEGRHCVNTHGSFQCVGDSPGLVQRAVAGSLAGFIVLFLLLLVSGLCLYWRKRKRESEQATLNDNPATPEVETANVDNALDGESPENIQNEETPTSV